MDALTVVEGDDQIEVIDQDGLSCDADEMHLDASLRLVPAGLVVEMIQLEVAT